MNWKKELNNVIKMRSVKLSDIVLEYLDDLTDYLVDELKISEEAACKRVQRIRLFLASLSNPADYALCRFQKWRDLGYRCAVFEKSWVFAYEIFDGGVIVRDMSHTTMLVQ
jgi:hypothetical protein